MKIKLVTVISRIVKKDVTTLAGMAVLTACGSSGTLGVKENIRSLGDTTTPVATPVPPVVAPAAPAAPAPAAPLATGARKKLGVNVGSVDYWNGDRVFANLLVGSPWLEGGKSGWPAVDVSRLDENNYPKTIANGEVLTMVLTPPESVLTLAGANIRCTYEGSPGFVDVMGSISNKKLGNHVIDFFWPGARLADQRVFLQVHGNSSGNSIRNLDCREADMSRDAVFAPQYLDSLKPFKVLRFLDMSAANANSALKWADRTLPNAVSQVGRTGAAIENMVSMANTLSADAWFNISWNADEEFVTKMAQMIHDKIGPNQHVYVEMSNEVWNYAFAVTTQAQNEGLAKGFSTNNTEAMLRRYAEKTVWAMKIWTKVFADRPGQLVRVVATQHVSPWSAETVLKFADTADWVDALATAPYFGHDLFTGSVQNSTDLNVLMPALAKEADETITVWAAQNQALAKSYGKRYIAYEAGQHVFNPGNVSLLAAVNRDDRMQTIYRKYLADWRTKVGDVMMLFSSSGPIGPWGAWGLREYGGQPLSETPKRRAVIEDAPNWNG